MNCSKCQGLCVEESEREGSNLVWCWKCMNCGKRTVSSRSEQRAERIDAEEQSFETSKTCAAMVNGGGTCKSIRIYGEKYCRRHLEKLNPATKSKMSDALLAGIKEFNRSVPIPTTQPSPRSETSDEKLEDATPDLSGTHWNTSVLSILKEKRALIESKLGELDQAIALIEGL